MKNRLPAWFKQEIPNKTTLETVRLISEFNVNTVCKEAKCPNLNRCFNNSRLTFIILGDTCTRDCRFCGVNKLEAGRSLTVDEDEPERVRRIVEILGLKYAVITSVTRDDLKDGGAGHFAKTIELIRGMDKNINPIRDTTNSSNNPKVSNGVKVEVLIPDFLGNIASLRIIADAQPNVVAHNIETVRRLYKDIRPKADYRRSLDVLSKIKELNPSLITKSSIMLGLGETEEEVVDSMKDLRHSRCDILILGQYLAPSIYHYPVKQFIDIRRFQRYRRIGLVLGFKAVLSGPLVRSSYQAEEIYKESQCMT